MAIFNSHVSLPEGTSFHPMLDHHFPSSNCNDYRGTLQLQTDPKTVINQIPAIVIDHRKKMPMISPLMVYTSILDHSSRPLKNSLLTSHLEEPWDNFPLLDGLPHPGGIVTIGSHLLGGWARPSEKSESMGRINYPIYIIYEMEKKRFETTSQYIYDLCIWRFVEMSKCLFWLINRDSRLAASCLVWKKLWLV